MLGRRAWLAGASAAMLCPVAATGQGRTAALLDRASDLPPADALALLAGAVADDPGGRLDLSTARAGLAVDAALVRMGAPAPDGLKPWVAARAGARGLAADREGAALHALLAQRQAGTIDIAAAEPRLTAELGRLHARADRLFAEIVAPRGTVGARYAALWADARHHYADDERGRADAVRDMNAHLARLRPLAGALVGPVPPFALAATIRALTPAEIAAGRPGYRDLPTAQHPGAYVVDLRDIRRRPRWTLPSVVAHETLPGHFAQLPIEAARPPHSLRLDYAAAFVEGWAIHAETLVAYQDPRDALGHLHWLLFRITRALADIGIHRHGWSIDEARTRLIAWQGVPAYFAPWETELPRIVREPGARVGEAMSWLTIADAAARRHGPAARAFHQRLLAGGRCRIEAIGA